MRIPLMRRPAPLEPELTDLKKPGGLKPAARAEAEASQTMLGWGEWTRQLARQVLSGGTVSSRADGAYRDLESLSASGEGVPGMRRRGTAAGRT